jgi:hypothetical protein
MDRQTIEDLDIPENFRAIVVPDETPDPSYLEQEGFEARLAEYRAGEFAFAGVILEHLCECCGEWKSVGSLWGIEHDGTHASNAYLADVALELFEEDQAQADADADDDGSAGFPIKDPEQEDFHADG